MCCIEATCCYLLTYQMCDVPCHLHDHNDWRREPSRSQKSTSTNKVFMRRLDDDVLFCWLCVRFRLGPCFTLSDQLLKAGRDRGSRRAAPEPSRSLRREDPVTMLLSCQTGALAPSPPPLPHRPGCRVSSWSFSKGRQEEGSRRSSPEPSRSLSGPAPTGPSPVVSHPLLLMQWWRWLWRG